MDFVYLWKKTTPIEVGVTLVLACFAQMFVGKSKRRDTRTHPRILFYYDLNYG